MASTPSDLQAPILLVAMPHVLDPYFHRTVVLLVHHDEEGSFGFIINRATGIRVEEILKGMDISWSGESEALAYFGGPVQPQLGSVVASGLSPGFLDDDFSGNEVGAELAVTQHIGDLERLSGDLPQWFRLFLGYAGWGQGQLMEEILRNDWLMAPVKKDLVFPEDPSLTWSEALRSVGVDPASLATWTGGSSGPAN